MRKGYLLHYFASEPIKIQEFRRSLCNYEKAVHTSHHMFCLVEVQCSCLRTIPVGSGQYPRLLILGTVRCTPNIKDTQELV